MRQTGRSCYHLYRLRRAFGVRPDARRIGRRCRRLVDSNCERSSGRRLALGVTAPAGPKLQHIIMQFPQHLFAFVTKLEIEPK